MAKNQHVNDGDEFWFATTFYVEFFEMPEGYTGDQMIDVVPHATLNSKCYETKHFSDCFIEV